MTYTDPPGIRCDGCRTNIDARIDVVRHGDRWFCTDECRRATCLGDAEQMVIGGVRR